MPVQGEENDHSTDGCPGPTWCKSSGWPAQLVHCSTADIAACRFVLSLPSLTCCRSLPIPGYDFLLAQRISTSKPALFLRTARCWSYCTAERGTIPRRRRDSPHGLRLRRRPRRKWFRISHSWTPSSEAGLCCVPLPFNNLIACTLSARRAFTTDAVPFFRMQEVGRRLALINRALIYHEEIDYVGPRVIAERVTVTTVTDRKSGAVHTTVRIPFSVGTNGNLHLNGTGGCTTCCNGTTSVSPHSSSNLAAGRSNPSSPVGLLDPTIGTGAKVYKTQTFVVDAATSVLTATIPGWQAASEVAEVQFLFDNFPQCAVYSGALSGPDSYYAEVKHFGLVAESWRGNVTIEAIVV